jgi:hypothetical protein
MLRLGSVAAAIALVAVGSWLVASNHCTLTVAASEEKVAQSECPFHSHPSKPAKQNDSSDQPCCKILRAVTTSPAKKLAPTVVDRADVDLDGARLIVSLPAKISFGPVVLDTGPPGPNSFAELVLQRSILAHAPPSRA